MEDDINQNIKNYCEKINMNMEKLSITVIDSGYVAADGNTSIMFDKKGKVSSMPMHYVYGKKTTKLMGKSYAISMYIAIAIAVIVLIIGNVIKLF